MKVQQQYTLISFQSEIHCSGIIIKKLYFTKLTFFDGDSVSMTGPAVGLDDGDTDGLLLGLDDGDRLGLDVGY